MYYKNMYYEIFNSGPKSILFLHGWGGSSKSFEIIKKYFKDSKLIFVDLPGFGNSTIDTLLGLSDYTRIINDFIEYLNLSNLTIVAHSFGGRILLKMLENRPYRSVLVSTPGYEYRSIKTKLKLLSNKYFKIKFPSKDYANATPLQRLTMKKCIKDTENINYEKIKGDVLIIHSKLDKTVPFKVAIKMHKAIKNSGLIDMGSSHFPFIDKPYEFYKVIDTYANL